MKPQDGVYGGHEFYAGADKAEPKVLIMDRSDFRREHFLSVAIAKHVFSHPKFGIVFVGDAVRLADAKRYGLEPLIVYGIAAARTGIQWLTFARADMPRSLCCVLQEAWQSAAGLKGVPDVLRISNNVAKSAPDLAATLGGFGVEVVIADASDKQLPAALRNVQNAVMSASWSVDRIGAIKSLGQLCSAAKSLHERRMMYWFTNDKEVVARCQQWAQVPPKPFLHELPQAMDWTTGPWLSAWDKALPPASPRKFHHDRSVCFLRTMDGDDSDDAESFNAGGLYDGASEASKLVVDCWPVPVGDLASFVGVAVKELKWFLSGRVELPGNATFRLLEIIGVERCRQTGYFDPVGSCVLIPPSLRAGTSVYEAQSGGGDLEYSVEVTPTTGLPDPSWRYLLFCSYGGWPSIMMMQRGGKVAEGLASDAFINFDGALQVPAKFYQDVVATCARACRGSTVNRIEMLKFVERNADYLNNLNPGR